MLLINENLKVIVAHFLDIICIEGWEEIVTAYLICSCSITYSYNIVVTLLKYIRYSKNRRPESNATIVRNWKLSGEVFIFCLLIEIINKIPIYKIFLLTYCN